MPRSLDPALGLLTVQRADGRTDPATDPFLPAERLLSLHREMRRLREVDRVLVSLQRGGRVAFHASIEGEEAVVIGAAAALEAADWVFPGSREGGIVLSRGVPLATYLAQSFGTRGDVSKGRQMPGHVSSRPARVASRSSSVAAQLPQAVGLAWAAQKRGDRVAVLSFVGDGGTSAADFHAALNFAGVFRVPCIVVCRNNQVASSTTTNRQTASATFAVKGVAYGVPGVRVDGTDLLAVYRAVQEARVRALAGGGPTLVECVTHPERMGAGADGPSPDVVDPVLRFRQHLTYIGALDDAHDIEILDEIAAELSDALATVEAESPPELRTLFEDVYAEAPFHLVEQREQTVGPA